MKQLPYGVQTPKDIVEPARAWCQEQWGPRWEAVGDREGTWTVFWGGRGIPSHYQWWFETEQQQIMFTLKWAA
jgi:hypothetical protein